MYSGVYTYLVNTNFYSVLLYNNTDFPVYLNTKNMLGRITKIEKEHYYIANIDLLGLAALSPFKSKANCLRPDTSDDEDIEISYNIKIHKNTYSEKLNKIVRKYGNI